jgi:hypothetical protein
MLESYSVLQGFFNVLVCFSDFNLSDGRITTCLPCQDCTTRHWLCISVLLSPAFPRTARRMTTLASARLRTRRPEICDKAGNRYDTVIFETTLVYSTVTFAIQSHSPLLFRHDGLPRGARLLSTLALTEVLARSLSAGFGATGVLLSLLIGPSSWGDMTYKLYMFSEHVNAPIDR